ncbi:Hsp20/alpha crystallin family protein [Mesobacillus harenae]|uniref:Hsp20/alpha crystallin family protein n=1 Tax=Mesobacillus harenae TaxID=2213203 RepID=UPI0015801E80|nr:Hsp20/alpha crystallin family protein [Mesobacillus harenae]
MFPWNLFPFSKDMQKKFQNMNTEEFEKHIENVVSKAIPSNLKGMSDLDGIMQGFGSPTNPKKQTERPVKIEASIFETHDFVYVRLTIQDEEWLKKIKIYHTSNQMIIEHIPNEEDKQVLTLPALVKKKGAVARYKEDTLEIKIPKSVDMQFSEIDVQDH